MATRKHKQMANCFVGIDPGLTGALAVIYSNGACVVHDLPVFTRKVGAKNRLVPDWYGVASMVRDYSDGLFMIEHLQPMPKNGVSGNWASGRFFGGFEAMLAVLEMPIKTVTPARWKRHFGLLKQPKDASRKKALDLFPDMYHDLRLKKHHGRAEALLIAEFNRRTAETIEPA